MQINNDILLIFSTENQNKNLMNNHTMQNILLVLKIDWLKKYIFNKSINVIYIFFEHTLNSYNIKYNIHSQNT